MKKQTITVMSQSRKSSKREEITLRPAREALELKETEVAEASQATSQENYMLDLMNDASLDMAGMLRFITPLLSVCAFVTSLFPLSWLGSFLDATAVNQRVDATSEVLTQLAMQNNANFWSNLDRTRQIVRFQDCAAQVREYLDFCTKTLSMV
jgi:hypothetical protein